MERDKAILLEQFRPLTPTFVSAARTRTRWVYEPLLLSHFKCGFVSGFLNMRPCAQCSNVSAFIKVKCISHCCRYISLSVIRDNVQGLSIHSDSIWIQIGNCTIWLIVYLVAIHYLFIFFGALWLLLTYWKYLALEFAESIFQNSISSKEIKLENNNNFKNNLHKEIITRARAGFEIRLQEY